MEFLCQKCGRELEVDDSLLRVDTSNPFGLPASSSTGLKNTPSIPSPSLSSSVLSAAVSGSVDDSGVEPAASLVPDTSLTLSSTPARASSSSSSSASSSTRQVTYNDKLVSAQHIFRVASELSSIDMPICAECTELLFAEYDDILKQETKENQAYKLYLAQLQKGKLLSDGDSKVMEQIRALEAEERSLEASIREMADERVGVRKQLQDLQVSGQKIDILEEKYWKDYNKYLMELREFEEEREALKVQLKHSMGQLDTLQKTDVYNDTFHIWHEGHFGTINGFRLGRLPSQPVEWNEINAAWGQTCFLLHCIANKLNFQFSTYKLVPLGSFSRIENTEDGSVYELYSSSDISIGKLFRDRRYDNAMVAFLKCLKEVVDFVKELDEAFKLPYAIEKDKVGGMIIKAHFANEASWTKSLKYMLIDLKWLLGWLVKKG